MYFSEDLYLDLDFTEVYSQGSSCQDVSTCIGLYDMEYDSTMYVVHDDVIDWKHCTRYWPFVWGINRSPVNSPHKG